MKPPHEGMASLKNFSPMHRRRPSERPLIGALRVLEPILHESFFFLAMPQRFDNLRSHVTAMSFCFGPYCFNTWCTICRVIDATSQHRQRWRKSLRFLRLKDLGHDGTGRPESERHAFTITWRKNRPWTHEIFSS